MNFVAILVKDGHTLSGVTALGAPTATAAALRTGSAQMGALAGRRPNFLVANATLHSTLGDNND